MNKPKAAYLGPPGTFSHEAAKGFWRTGFEICPCGSAKEVVRHYREKEAEEVILAIDSSIGGTVGENLDEIAGLEEVRIVAETMLAVHHQLAGSPKGKIPAIKTVLAHPKAIEECEVWLTRNLPEALRVPFPSSSAAAKEALADPSGETAAIASRVAADFCGMKILAADIETSPLNTTRFWILGRETPPGTGRDRTTLLIAGDLHEALAMLVNGGIRILSSYERPAGGKIENALYFIDVAGHIQDGPFSRTLRHVPGGRWLGSYPRKY